MSQLVLKWGQSMSVSASARGWNGLARFLLAFVLFFSSPEPLYRRLKVNDVRSSFLTFWHADTFVCEVWLALESIVGGFLTITLRPNASPPFNITGRIIPHEVLGVVIVVLGLVQLYGAFAKKCCIEFRGHTICLRTFGAISGAMTWFFALWTTVAFDFENGLWHPSAISTYLIAALLWGWIFLRAPWGKSPHSRREQTDTFGADGCV